MTLLWTAGGKQWFMRGIPIVYSYSKIKMEDDHPVSWVLWSKVLKNHHFSGYLKLIPYLQNEIWYQITTICFSCFCKNHPTSAPNKKKRRLFDRGEVFVVLITNPRSFFQLLRFFLCFLWIDWIPIGPIRDGWDQKNAAGNENNGTAVRTISYTRFCFTGSPKWTRKNHKGERTSDCLESSHELRVPIHIHVYYISICTT